MSPQASMVGRAVLDWDVEIYWPQPASDDNLSVAAAVNDCRYTSTAKLQNAAATSRCMIMSTVATGTGVSVHTARAAAGVPGGVPVVCLYATAAPPDQYQIGLEGMRAILDTTGVVPVALGAAWPSLLRVWWLRALIRYRDDGAGPPTADSGFLVMPQDAAIHGWPTEVVGGNNRGGFGLVGDWASAQWQYASFDRTGVSLVREVLPLPVHTLDDYNMVEWVMVGARPGFNAYMEFWFNNTLILTRNWLGGMLEPIGGEPMANEEEWGWVPRIRLEGQAALFVGGVVNRQGRFLRDGTEIQG